MGKTHVSYDRSKKSLVYTGPKSDSQFWDAHWVTDDFRKVITQGNGFVANQTKRFLPKGARVLEGGCGQGNTVWGLQGAGFDACGLDYAEATVNAIKDAAPELEIILGDVRALQFEDASFDGYWSLGVIEHFYDGYDAILSEMARVVRPGGYVFLTFPTMSRLRRLKAMLGLYPAFQTTQDIHERFYQFALSPSVTIEDFNEVGFTLVEHTGMDATKGIKDEIRLLKPWLQKVYDNPTRINRYIRKVLERLFKNFGNHISFCVLLRTETQ